MSRLCWVAAVLAWAAQPPPITILPSGQLTRTLRYSSLAALGSTICLWRTTFGSLPPLQYAYELTLPPSDELASADTDHLSVSPPFGPIEAGQV